MMRRQTVFLLSLMMLANAVAGCGTDRAYHTGNVTVREHIGADQYSNQWWMLETDNGELESHKFCPGAAIWKGLHANLELQRKWEFGIPDCELVISALRDFKELSQTPSPQPGITDK